MTNIFNFSYYSISYRLATFGLSSFALLCKEKIISIADLLNKDLLNQGIFSL